jgi:glucose/arabinose dehydrogenase
VLPAFDATIRRMQNLFARVVIVTLLFLCAMPSLVSAAGIALKPVAEGLVSPTVLVPLDDGSGRLLIADQVGTLQTLSKEGKLEQKLFLDLRGRLTKLNQGFDERGVLGVALHPKFRDNRKLYVYYSAPRRKEAPEKWDHTSHVSEFTASSDFSQADPASERIFLQIDKPQFNHNCGRLIFGPDGFLYIGVGDGGQGNDTGLGHNPELGNGQDTKVLLGKILRIDVDGGQPYGVPKDNPFADGSKGRPEIFAYGLRNPWGISFDRGGKRELFAADVGQDAFEEVNIIVKGGNYGWRIREGFSCFDPKKPLNPPEDCPKVGAMGEPLIDPIVAYKNFKRFAKDPEAKGISVTGGYVYRGKALPQLAGKYVFADWSRAWVSPDGVLYTASPDGASGKWKMDTLDVGAKLGAYVLAFGQDSEGELYVLTTGRNALTGNTGKVLKLVPM